MFERILAAIDGSENADHALDMAVEIAGKFGSELTVLAVVPITTGYMGAPVLATDDIVQEYQKLVDERVEKIDRSRLKSVTRAVLEGYVIDEILGYLDKHPQDLLVVGARGLSTAGRLFLGSTSDALVHHAKCPTLVYRAPPPTKK